MKVQLFIPPVFHYSGAQYRMLPTLALPTIAAVLNRAGHYAETVDLEALGRTPSQLQKAFAQQPEAWPDVVGFTSLTISARGAQESVEAVRKAGYKGMVAVGGVFPTYAPEEALNWGADLVVTGECEGNIVGLLEQGATGIQAGKPLPIDQIPIPDFHHFSPDITTYFGNMSILRPNPGISMWTRGCPYSCIFCSNIIFGHRATRYRPTKLIIEEMHGLKKRGCQHIFVYDDELVGTHLPEGWMHEIANGIEGIGMDWVTQGRCSKKYISKELMADMKRAGCRAIFWGVESFSDRVLKAVKKHTTQEDIWHTLRLAKEAGIENGVFTMIANYTETEEDLAITEEGLRKAYKEGLINYRQTTVCTGMPGTELAEIQKREGWYVEAPNGGRQMLQVFNATPWLSVEQIEKWMRRFAEACPCPIIG